MKFAGMRVKEYTVEECFDEIRNGANIKQEKGVAGYPITRIETLSDDKFNRDRMGYAGITDIAKYKDYILKDGELLMSHINSPKYLGRTVMYHAIKNEIIIHGMNLLKLRAKKTILMPEYAELLFYAPIVREQINKITKKSVNQASFSVSDLKKIKIFLPCIEEQIVVVKKIDKIKKIKNIKIEELKELDTLIKARFVEMFGNPDTNPFKWNETALSQHIEVIGGYAFKSEMFKNAGIPVLRIGNINSGYFVKTNMVYWSEDSTLKRYKIYPGDLVMSLTGTVGKDDYGNVCILGNDYPEYYLNQRNAKIALQSSMNKYYLSELFKFSEIKMRLTGISRGVRQANISNKDILCLVVPIPPIELQTQFADFVAQVDKSKLY